MNVVFPAPFGPMMPSISPHEREKEMSLTASKPPNRLHSPRVSRSGMCRSRAVVIGAAGWRAACRARHCPQLDAPAVQAVEPLRHEKNDQHDDDSIHDEVPIGNFQLQVLRGNTKKNGAKDRAGRAVDPAQEGHGERQESIVGVEYGIRRRIAIALKLDAADDSLDERGRHKSDHEIREDMNPARTGAPLIVANSGEGEAEPGALEKGGERAGKEHGRKGHPVK